MPLCPVRRLRRGCLDVAVLTLPAGFDVCVPFCVLLCVCLLCCNIVSVSLVIDDDDMLLLLLQQLLLLLPSLFRSHNYVRFSRQLILYLVPSLFRCILICV